MVLPALPALPVLLAFLVPYVEPIVSSMVVDRIAKYGRSIDWTKVKNDTNAKVKGVLPDLLFTPETEQAILLFVDKRVSDFAAALQDTATEKAILDALLTGNVHEAWQILAAKVKPPVAAVAAAASAASAAKP